MHRPKSRINPSLTTLAFTQSTYTVLLVMQNTRLTVCDETSLFEQGTDNGMGEHAGVHLPCIHTDQLFQKTTGPGRVRIRKSGSQRPMSARNSTSAGTTIPLSSTTSSPISYRSEWTLSADLSCPFISTTHRETESLSPKRTMICSTACCTSVGMIWEGPQEQ